ncbi:FK506-binding protein 39 kDa-like [Cryptomeria japonica]|uniref:FK506-binding protein 39 kDa-like n=1 Tax=Cryptomeria japonica TaxID=3369 RepID=UPI0027DA5068|nr:FK506-binding protein 39 kDa-like [Cryptomeria japonica]
MEHEKIERSSGERRSARLQAKERKKPIKSEENKTNTSLYTIFYLEDEEDSKDNSEDEDFEVEEEELTKSPNQDLEAQEEGEEKNNKLKSEHESPFKNANHPNTFEEEKMVSCLPMRQTEEANNNVEEQLNEMKKKVAMLEKNYEE